MSVIEASHDISAPPRGAALTRRRALGAKAARGAQWVAVWATILFVGAALRTQEISNISYWFDESFGWKLIQFPYADVVRRVAIDNHPPLYFLSLKAWSAVFGGSPAALRSFSGLLGLATVGAAYLMALEAFGARRSAAANPPGFARHAALLTAAFVSLSAFQIQWSLQVRMYTLFTALAAASSWLLLRAVHAKGRSIAAWSAYSLSVVLLAYTHYYGFCTIAAQAAFMFGLAVARYRARKIATADYRPLLAFLLAGGAAYLAWLPWLPVFLDQQSQVRDAFWLPAVDWRAVTGACWQMFSHSQHDQPSAPLRWCCFALCAALVLATAWRRPAEERYLALAAALPPAIATALSLMVTPVFLTRYFISAHLFLLTALAGLLCRIRSRRPRIGAVVLSLMLFATIAAAHWRVRAAQSQLPGIRGAVAWLDANRASDEVVLVCSPLLFTDVVAHARYSDGIRVFRGGAPFLHFHGTAVLRDDEIVGRTDLRNWPMRWLWTVETLHWEKGDQKIPLPARWQVAGERRFAGIYGDGYEIIVRLYEQATNPSF